MGEISTDSYDYYRIRVNFPYDERYIEVIKYISSMDSWNRNEFIKNCICKGYKKAKEEADESSALIDICRENGRKIDLLDCKFSEFMNGGASEDEIMASALEYLDKFK